jgi:hypothetical protein
MTKRSCYFCTVPKVPAVYEVFANPIKGMDRFSLRAKIKVNIQIGEFVWKPNAFSRGAWRSIINLRSLQLPDLV